MATNSTSQLNYIRRKLNDAVGDDFKIYLNSMKMWFRQKITKEDFDTEARHLLKPETVHLHNEFLLAILNKCQSLSSSHKSSHQSGHVLSKDKQKKGKIKKKIRAVRATFEHRFSPAVPLSYAPQISSKELNQEENRLTFCSREFLLPDISMIHGRMYVAAWDSGLDEVEDNSVTILYLAVQLQIKRLLRAVCSRRSAYKLRDGKFQYAFGSAPPNPYIKNTYKTLHHIDDNCATSISEWGEHVPSMKPTWDWAESEAASEMGCSLTSQHRLPPISPADLLEGLQVHRDCLPSHSVYAINVERIISRLWHPSLEELDQESIHKQEEQIKTRILREQSTQYSIWQNSK